GAPARTGGGGSCRDGGGRGVRDSRGGGGYSRDGGGRGDRDSSQGNSRESGEGSTQRRPPRSDDSFRKARGKRPGHAHNRGPKDIEPRRYNRQDD
ncbi:MAG: hypothetical protein L7S56_03950, partial [Candidatus Poseidonia sp.]|nr:hypothetical protein [Poseidonia sp.]